MASITFDTLQYVDTLTSAGIPESQAKAMAKAQAQATKEDVRRIENELMVQRWMIGATLAGVGAIVMKLFFVH